MTLQTVRKSLLSLSLIGFVAAFAAASDAETDSSYRNVYGNSLQSCSSDGMALTGYTRNGYCVDRNDDQGSHHICIDLSSTSSNGKNFCTVTGQSDWCSSQAMPCHENSNEAYCSIQNWCVCQWAFASYIENAGGCDSIQTIVCESLNLEAILAYQEQISSEKYANALQCLVERCGLDMDNLPSRHANNLWNKVTGGSRPASSVTQMAFLVIVGICAMVAAMSYVLRKWNVKHHKKSSSDYGSTLLNESRNELS